MIAPMIQRMLIAIDPGSSSGAIAYMDGSGTTAMNMPKEFGEIFDSLNRLATKAQDEQYGIHCVMEHVGGTRPGNAAKAARTFAEHVGALKMALVACGIEPELVGARKWMRVVFPGGHPGGSTPPEKKARKDFIYDQLQLRYPGVKFTKRQADALGLLDYAKKTNRYS